MKEREGKKTEKRTDKKAKMEKLFESASDEVKAIHEKRMNKEEISDEEKEVMKNFLKKIELK
jgi:hypothetical protein